MKLYIISGLGADFKVLEKLKFPDKLNVVFIDWLIPTTGETFSHYIERMTEKIDNTEPFSLLGYSFGGIIVQEIHKKKHAQKVIILGSIKSDKEKSGFIKAIALTKLPHFLPERMFHEKTTLTYSIIKKIFGIKNPKIKEYFTVRNPYYLKWSIEKIADWKFEENPEVIQIMGDKDIVFPIKYSKPNYTIKNGTHLFPLIKSKEVSEILAEILK